MVGYPIKMKLFNTSGGTLLQHNNAGYLIATGWDELINRDYLKTYLHSEVSSFQALSDEENREFLQVNTILPPIASQEVWAAGVTYLKSRDARMEESQSSGAASLYDRVYDAERPELFFKANASRVSGHNQEVYIRKDSAWNVPEPELTLFMSSSGKIQGYTIGNDMSSRSIEGENALYLPQAKIYQKSAGLGPCLYISQEPVSGETAIRMKINRNGTEVYSDATSVSQIKRPFEELSRYLFAECDFEHGCYLMTGTCLVPPADFTLQPGDVVEISIDNIGTLVNSIAYHPKHQ